jgi:hypothetical protein
MLLYKYKSLRNLDHTLDILLNERLYCSPYLELNDPFEGLFSASIHIPPRERAKYPFFRLPDSLKVTKSVDDLPYDSKDRVRICSLSASPSDILLWSHYADGHKGIAIEIDALGLEAIIHEVKYADVLPQYSYTLLGMPTPEELLTHKTQHWKYEAEHRVLCEEPFLDVAGKIRRVLLGSRISRLHGELLHKVCSPQISLVHTKIDTESLKVIEIPSI